ncbi:peroxiredoxin [Enterovirga sp.]|uniref:peroxiredoxin n=1 Tax=Enterovirga sp. TaxID=2026350 RepID=UPI002CBCA0E7|nr:peroxiredoxin [Enterovirga sp.]HMO29168.1 peroxiredoxin [Enterovirga sp.]
MAIKAGDTLPQATFRVMTPDGPAAKTTEDLFKGRKVVLVAVPGAFTPTCDRNHLPGYIQHADDIKAAGIDAILVTSTNDVFVQKAWSAASGADGKVEMLSDGNGDFARAIGLSFDGSGFGLGIRSQRYAMVVDDGVVRSIAVEDAPGKADVSSAESLLKSLGGE